MEQQFEKIKEMLNGLTSPPDLESDEIASNYGNETYYVFNLMDWITVDKLNNFVEEDDYVRLNKYHTSYDSDSNYISKGLVEEYKKTCISKLIFHLHNVS